MKNGWPLNEETYPPVAGPGDTVRMYMNSKIHSIKGYWRGVPSVSVIDKAGRGKVYAAPATTNQNDWGHSISAKSSEKNESSTPYVNATLPDEPTLGGKTVDVSMKLEVTYPEISITGTSFGNEHTELHRQLSIHLAKDALAGAAYDRYWWEGTGIGAGLLLVSGLMLYGAAGSLAAKATPTRALIPAQPAVAAGPVPPPMPTKA